MLGGKRELFSAGAEQGEYLPVWVSGNGGYRARTAANVTVDTRKCLFSAWITRIQTPGTASVLFAQRSGGLATMLYLGSGGEVTVAWGNFINGQGFTVSAANAFRPNMKNHILFSFDGSRANADKVQVWVNGVEISMGSLSLTGTAASTNLMYFFNGASTATPFVGVMTDYYLNYGETLDLDVQANREKFRSADGLPVDLGADGSTPTGNQPNWYFGRDMTAVNWLDITANRNLGSDNSTYVNMAGSIRDIEFYNVIEEYTITSAQNGTLRGYADFSTIGTPSAVWGSIDDNTFIASPRICPALFHSSNEDVFNAYLTDPWRQLNDSFDILTIEGVTDPDWTSGPMLYQSSLGGFSGNDSNATRWEWPYEIQFVNGHQYNVKLYRKAVQQVTLTMTAHAGSAGNGFSAYGTGAIFGSVSNANVGDLIVSRICNFGASSRISFQGANKAQYGSFGQITIKGITDPNWNGGVPLVRDVSAWTNHLDNDAGQGHATWFEDNVFPAFVFTHEYEVTITYAD